MDKSGEQMDAYNACRLIRSLYIAAQQDKEQAVTYSQAQLRQPLLTAPTALSSS